VFSLLGAVALTAPACGSDDGDSNNNGGSAGAAGHSTAGNANTAGRTNTAGAVSGGGAGSGAGGAGESPDCGKLDPTSGIVTCGEVKYRELAGKGCLYSPGDRESAGGTGAGGAGAAQGGAGSTDSECDPVKCTAKPRGYCEAEAPGASGAGPVTCHYGCLTDSECGATEICVCGDPTYGGRCVQAFCKTSADCTNGNRCGSGKECDQFSCNDDPRCAVN